MAKPWKIATNIATMPWACLQAAVEQILKEKDTFKQEKQLLEWQRLKNMELMNVSFVVRPFPSSKFRSVLNQL
jgi:hypothetical protein